nr:MAG TPA: hypothetical protein [Caudoviricetes sp.]
MICISSILKSSLGDLYIKNHFDLIDTGLSRSIHESWTCGLDSIGL